MKNHILITIILVIIVGAGAFWGGMQYEKSQSVSPMAQYAQNAGFSGGPGAGMMRRFGGGRNGMATIGKIISLDANSITVQLQDGSSKIINLSSSTKISKNEVGTQSDFANGLQVAVFGTTNSDGSVTATNVQINPGMRVGRTATPSSSQGQ